MASIENSLSFRGLETSPNNLGAGSEGALVVADNVTIRYPDVLEPRRGQESDAFGETVGAEIKQVSFFEDKVVAHTGTKVRVSGAAAELTGTYTAANPDFRLKTAIAASTFFMATDKGVMALEESTSTVPRLTGIAEPLAPTAAIVEDPTSPPPTIPGFLDPGKAVAYRVLFGYVDSNDALHLGPPSVRIAVKNTSAGQASVNIVVPLLTVPLTASGAIVSGTFVRVYRSVMQDTEALTGDELYLVNETVIDTTRYGVGDALILADTADQDFAVQSAPLYTSPTQGGLPNDAPPFAEDIATWSQREWYANTNQPHSLTAQLIGVEGGGNPDIPATGLRIGDTITVAGVTFTAADATDFAAREFLLWTSGPGPEANISKTLYWLALVVNQWAIDHPDTFNIRAYLEPVVFGNDLLNFKIRFQRPTVDSTTNTSFSVNYDVLLSTASVAGTPGNYTVTTTAPHNLKAGDYVRLYRLSQPNVITTDVFVEGPVTPTSFKTSSTYVNMLSGINRVVRYYGESVWTPDLLAGVTSDNERRMNYVYYSLPGEPEAVSAASYIPVGTSGKAIRRIVPQRDRLLVFKDEGTYAIYGDFPFQVSLIDDTVQILAPDSAVAIGSTVMVLTDDGIMAVTDGGIQMVSREIDSTLKPYLATPYRSTTATGVFGVSYESEKVFALFMPSLGITGYEAKAYVLGMETRAWTTWTYLAPRLCGRVDPFTDAAYYGLTNSPYLVKDRNTSSTADYEDEANLPILSTVQWASTTLGSPFATKQARELHAYFRDIRKPAGKAVTPTVTIKTDIVPAGKVINNLWLTTDSFSTATTIGPSVLPLQFRKLIPQEVQRATNYTLGLEIVTLGGYWAMNGYSIVYDNTSERTGTVR
jgi:hypothetical protein